MTARSRQVRVPTGRAARAAVLAMTALAGCAVGPDYRRPDAAPVPETYAGAAGEWKTATPQAHLPKGRWWEMFGDRELDLLEQDAEAQNQDLRAAAARFEQARAFADVGRSGLFPRLDVAAAAARQRDSSNRPVGGKPGATYNTFSIPFDLSYELDLWGGVRRRVEAEDAQAEAAGDDVEATRLVLQAEVAADYFTVRALDADMALLRASIEVYRKSLELTRNRRAGGVASDLDVAQAETVLRAAEAQVPATALQRAKFEHAIAVLTGRSASLFTLPERPLDAVPPALPPGLPSELLERRPDVAAAERRMAAANAVIGVAKAAFFPRFRFDVLGGWASGQTATLFDWPSRFWALGASLTAPLFDAGKLSAELRAAKASYEESVARYRQAVLVAFGEVEDSLAAQYLLAEEHGREAIALEAARRQLAIADNRYRAGIVTYLQVAVAQATALEHERATVRLRGQQFATTVALVKSLGGGWQVLPGAGGAAP